MTKIRSMIEREAEIPWAPLGREWWEAAGRDLGTTDMQVRFAACRFSGLNQTRSAILAGYAAEGDESARFKGHEAAKTKGVVALLTLAHATARADGIAEPQQETIITNEEVDLELSRIIKAHKDPSARLRAIEIHSKRQSLGQTEKDERESDGFAEWRMARNFLKLPNGATAFLLLWSGTGSSVSRLPLFHDIAAAAKREFPDLWRDMVRRHSAVMQQDLQEIESNPDWQRDAREKIWSEIGVPIAEVDAKVFGASVNDKSAQVA